MSKFKSSPTHLQVGLCVTIIVFLFFGAPFLFSTKDVPGDLGDARFNIYILDRLYEWLLGRTHDLASPPFFYPYPYALFFSDTHFGSAPFYIFFRAFTSSEYNAFTCWAIFGYFLTFWATHYALARLSMPPIAAAIGAALFTFSLPSLAQLGHAQLIYRFGVPLAFLHVVIALRDKSIPDAGWATFWVCVQMLVAVYTGVFTIILLTLFSGSYLILESRSSIPRKSFRTGWVQFRDELGAKTVAPLVLAGVAALATWWLLSAYAGTSAIYGLGRGWSTISTMLPRPSSYLLMDSLSYWTSISSSISDIPARHEHQMFMGLATLAFFIVGILSIRKPNGDTLMLWGALFSLFLSIVLITLVGGYSLYRLLTFLPGFNAIRSVTRIGLVLMFPVALVSSAGIRQMLEITVRPALGQIAIVALLGLFLFEITHVRIVAFSSVEAEAQIAKIVDAALHESRTIKDPVLQVFTPGIQPPVHSEIDGMLAAKRLGWATINGYSGFNPIPDWASLVCADQWLRRADRLTLAKRLMVKSRGILPKLSNFDLLEPAPALLQRIVVVGPIDACDFKVESGQTGTIAPPNPSSARDIVLEEAHFQKLQSFAAISVRVKNLGREGLAAAGLAENGSGKVSLSWRLTKESTPNSVGWDSRVALYDIPSGGEGKVTLFVPLPKEKGKYKLQVSMVAENRFWFHDYGMKILTAKELIDVF